MSKSFSSLKAYQNTELNSTFQYFTVHKESSQSSNHLSACLDSYKVISRYTPFIFQFLHTFGVGGHPLCLYLSLEAPCLNVGHFIFACTLFKHTWKVEGWSCHIGIIMKHLWKLSTMAGSEYENRDKREAKTEHVTLTLKKCRVAKSNLCDDHRGLC